MSEVTMDGLVEDQNGDCNVVEGKIPKFSFYFHCNKAMQTFMPSQKKTTAKCWWRRRRKIKNPQSNPRRKQINVSEEPNQVKIPPLFRLWWFKSQIFCLLLLGAQEFKCGPARFSWARYAALVPLAAPLPSSVWLFSSPPTRFLSFSFVADIVKGGLAFEGRRRLWSTSVWNYEMAFFFHLFFSSYWTKIIARYNRFQRSGFLCSANRLFLYFILLMLPTESKHW